MLLQCYFAHQTCMLFKWQDCTHILGSEEVLDMTAERRWSLGLPPCLVGEEYCAAWDCGVGTTDRVLIMVSAASLLQVRGGDRALPVDLGWMGATSTRGWGWKSGFVPPTGQPRKGTTCFLQDAGGRQGSTLRLTGEKYNSVTADWGGKPGSTHRLLLQHPRGRGSNVALSRCPPGECRCTKTFLSGSAALSPGLCLGRAGSLRIIFCVCWHLWLVGVSSPQAGIHRS